MGTEVWTGTRTPRLIADMVIDGQRVLLARGGVGGRGNTSFVSSVNRFPLLAEAGQPGEELTLHLELKLLADVSIVGAPNAGKSSLLAKISSATPKIADYPFTTLEPVLGVVDRGNRRLLFVEVPGLLEGASRGVGLGREFLRHVERTQALLHLVDGAAPDPVMTCTEVNEELKLHGRHVLDKPQIIAVNKLDLPEVERRRHSLQARLAATDCKVYFISALTGQGVDELLEAMFDLVAGEQRKQQISTTPVDMPVLRPRPRRQPVKVERQNGAFTVPLPSVVRVAAMVNESNWEARVQFFQYLKQAGVVKALEEAGIKTGDTVRVGKLTWEWE